MRAFSGRSFVGCGKMDLGRSTANSKQESREAKGSVRHYFLVCRGNLPKPASYVFVRGGELCGYRRDCN